MNKKIKITLSLLFFAITSTAPVLTEDLDVNISQEISFIDVIHNGEKIRIKREQNTKNMLILSLVEHQENVRHFAYSQ